MEPIINTVRHVGNKELRHILQGKKEPKEAIQIRNFKKNSNNMTNALVVTENGMN